MENHEKMNGTFNTKSLIAAATLAAGMAAAVASSATTPPSSTASAEFANDLGPASIDVSSYPKDLQETYKNVFSVKCAACHTLARPINSEFVEIDDPAEMAKLKKQAPQDFKDQFVLDIKRKIWSRYVHRMMYKPGAGISGRDGKRIWEFLVWDSKYRKLGLNGGGGPTQMEKWTAFRKGLLKEFQKDRPRRFALLYGKAGFAAP